MVSIDWTLLGPPLDIAGSVQESFQRGRAAGMQRRQQSALAGVAHGDPAAMQELSALNPQLAASMEDQAYQRAERARGTAARSALADLLVAPSGRLPSSAPLPANALAPLAQGMGGAETAMPAPMVEGASSPANALTGLATAQTPPTMTPNIGASIPPAGAGLRMRQGNEAFERLARLDPETAFKVRKMDVDQRASVADALGKQMEVGGRVMSAVLAAPVEQQPELYRQMRTELEESGVIDLPDEWDAESARARMRMGMTVLQAVGSDQRQQTVDWNLEDDELDNARDDRNVGSQIETREGQLANTRRGQDLTDDRGRRGQDMSSTDRRRGQDLTGSNTQRGQDLTDARGRRGQDATDARGRRGQDITDRRGRESASFKGTGGRGRAGRGGSTSAARITNPATGQVMVLKNGKWVPES